jgi:hypothetical protein
LAFGNLCKKKIAVKNKKKLLQFVFSTAYSRIEFEIGSNLTRIEISPILGKKKIKTRTDLLLKRTGTETRFRLVEQNFFV